MTTDSLLMKRRPKAHVRPSRKSSAMAPRAQDLGGVVGRRQDVRVPTVGDTTPRALLRIPISASLDSAVA